MEDERQWKLKRHVCFSEKDREQFIEQVKADPNRSFVSKGWDVSGQLTVTYWEAN